MIRVRPARQDDVAEIARIHVESWRSAYAGLLPDASLVRMSVAGQARQWRSVVRRADHLHRVFVAADARPDAPEAVIGFASCGPARHPAGSSRSPNDGEVFTLYVEPDRQGEGAGRALLERCLDTLAGERRRHAVVWVIAANPSRFFY
ncbi:MAG: GNAT family N-acetyltransferase, partial [Alphaproteobacteria bacterium]|nr:GNAT family N-acetyltransferase [Alphaproteobacteria bacterium]